MANDFRVPVAIPVETNASSAADSIQELRDSVTKSKDAIKASASAMRDLRGKSDEVKAAKDQLTAKIRAEEAAVTKNTLALIKHGGSLNDASKKTKDGAASASAMGKSIGAAGAPVASLKEKLGGLKETLGGSKGGMSAVAGVAALAAAAILAVGAAAAKGAFELGKFILVSADAARIRHLTIKANLDGNEQWAKNFESQVDRLAKSLPLAKEKIDEIGISLAKSRIGGQTMVDTMEAVGGATAAAGEDLGNKLKGIVERGAFTKRFQLSPQELLGMDLDFDDVAKAYATGMHVSVERARQELFSGRVKLADGAKALKDAVNEKFGEINGKKLLGFDAMATRFHETLTKLTSGVDIERLVKPLGDLIGLFDEGTESGATIKALVTEFGTVMVDTMTAALPIAKELFQGMVAGAVGAYKGLTAVKNVLKDAFGDTKVLKDGEAIKLAAGAVELGCYAVAAAVAAVAVGLAPFVYVGVKVVETFNQIKEAVQVTKDVLANNSWKEIGSAMVDGLVEGLKLGASKVIDAIKGLADDAKGAFKSALHIQSPSKDFFDFGKHTAKGAELGIEAGTPDVHSAAAAMAPVPGEGASGNSGGGGRGAVTITFAPVINLTSSGGDAAEQLKDPSLLQALTDAFLGQIRAAGIEVPA